MLATLDARRLRDEIDFLLRTDADLDAFCLDRYKAVHRRFASCMDRVQKVNLLLQLVPNHDALLAQVLAYGQPEVRGAVASCKGDDLSGFGPELRLKAIAIAVALGLAGLLAGAWGLGELCSRVGAAARLSSVAPSASGSHPAAAVQPDGSNSAPGGATAGARLRIGSGNDVTTRAGAKVRAGAPSGMPLPSLPATSGPVQIDIGSDNRIHTGKNSTVEVGLQGGQFRRSSDGRTLHD